MRLKAIIIILIVAILAGLTILGTIRQRKPKVPTQSEIRARMGVPVTVAELTFGPISETLGITGNLEALTSLTLSAKAPGRIASVLVHEGDRVLAGQTLVVMDRTEAESQVRSAQAAVSAADARLSQAITTAQAQEKQSRAMIAQAQAGLKIAESRLDIVRKGARTQERLVARNAVSTAKANLNNANANYNRYKTLHEQGAVSAQTLETFKTQYDIAKAQHDSAVQQLSLIEEGARSEDIQAAEGQVSEAREALRMARANAAQIDVRWEDVKGARAAVSQAQAALAAARQQLQYTGITTTISGVTASRMAEPGQTASPGVPLMTVVDLSTVYFDANVSEKDFRRVRVGQKVDVTVDAFPSQQFSGYVAKILPVASAQSRDFTVQVRIHNTGGRLRPGMFARGGVRLGAARTALLAPTSAVVERHGDKVLFTIRRSATAKGKAEGYIAVLHTVRTGVETTEVVEILPPTELSPGQEVVVSGQRSLRDGTEVYLAD